MSEAIPNWQVLLIGGSSGVGKSTVAQELAKTLHVSHLLVDDLRIAIQALTSPQQLPALHYFLTAENPADLPAEAFIAGLIGVGQALTPALSQVISHHIAVPSTGQILLEGDGILPQFVDELVLAGVNGAALVGGRMKVRTVFIYEENEAQLLHNFVARSRGFNCAATAEQQRYVETIWRFGLWVNAEAERYGLTVIPARPYATLAQRILATLG